jgi:hypothetical protein
MESEVPPRIKPVIAQSSAVKDVGAERISNPSLRLLFTSYFIT